MKDILEDEDLNPRETNEGEMNTMEKMKRELKRLKVVENREEPFGKDTKTYYTKTDDNRSRYNRWRNDLKTQGYKRSESNPRYFRTELKNKWICDDSKYGRSGSRYERSQSRSGSAKRSFFNRRKQR